MGLRKRRGLVMDMVFGELFDKLVGIMVED